MLLNNGHENPVGNWKISLPNRILSQQNSGDIARRFQTFFDGFFLFLSSNHHVLEFLSQIKEIKIQKVPTDDTFTRNLDTVDREAIYCSTDFGNIRHRFGIFPIIGVECGNKKFSKFYIDIRLGNSLVPLSPTENESLHAALSEFESHLRKLTGAKMRPNISTETVLTACRNRVTKIGQDSYKNEAHLRLEALSRMKKELEEKIQDGYIYIRLLDAQIHNIESIPVSTLDLWSKTVEDIKKRVQELEGLVGIERTHGGAIALKRKISELLKDVGSYCTSDNLGKRNDDAMKLSSMRRDRQFIVDQIDTYKLRIGSIDIEREAIMAFLSTLNTE